MSFVWTEENIGAFWDKVSSSPAMKYQYFSLQRGKSVYNYLKKNAPLDGVIADLGCGRGDMIARLMKNGVACMGMDVSPGSVNETEKRFSGDKNFKGARRMNDFYHLPVEDNSLDGVILLEVIEHLFPDKIELSLKEILRVLKPGGFFFLTTPNNEPIEKRRVTCPSCQCHFHPIQHLSGFDQKKLSTVVNRAGFKQKRCEAVFMMIDPVVYWKSAREDSPLVCPACLKTFKAPPVSLFKWIVERQYRSLIYLGTKP